MLESEISIRESSINDIEELNKVYFKVTGLKRTTKQIKWEWYHYKTDLSWVILYKKKIVGHHGYIKVPMVLNKKRFFIIRTENSMLLKEYRKKIPYFFIERDILNKLKKKYKLVITTAGKNAPINMRIRLGYKKTAKWQILVFNNHIFHKLNSLKKLLFFLKKKKIETKDSILKKNTNTEKLGLLNPSTRVLCSEAKKNISKNLLSLYPTEKYLNWRFFSNPYHNYFSVIINLEESKNKIIVIWYEVRKSDKLYDIYIEYLSFSSALYLENVLNKVKEFFQGTFKCRIIYRVIYREGSIAKNNKHASLLICFSDKSLEKFNFYFDSSVRQGIHS